MLEEAIMWFINLVRELGWVGVIIGVLAETFLMPIPSPLIPLAAGFIVLPQEISIQEAVLQSFFIIGLAGAVGATLGAFFGYGIGYFGGRPIIERYGHFFGFSWNEIEKFSIKMRGKVTDEAALIISRAIPVIPLSPISLLAGLIRLNPMKFAICTFIGTVPRFFTLGLLGWLTGETYMKLAEILGFYETLTLILIIVSIIIFSIIYKKRRL